MVNGKDVTDTIDYKDLCKSLVLRIGRWNEKGLVDDPSYSVAVPTTYIRNPLEGWEITATEYSDPWQTVVRIVSPEQVEREKAVAATAVKLRELLPELTEDRAKAVAEGALYGD